MPELLLLTDRAQLTLGRSLLRTITECAAAGLTHVVVREHDLATHTRHALIARLVEIEGLTVISARTPAPLAHGVMARNQGCHSAEEVRAAARNGAAFATLSPYAETKSKPGYGPPLDKGVFAEDFGIPIYALGGITTANAAEARKAGAHGIAVMGEVMRAHDSARVIKELLR